MVSIRNVVMAATLAVPGIAYTQSGRADAPAFTAPSSAAAPHFPSAPASVAPPVPRDIVYKSNLQGLETDPVFKAWLAKRAAAARKHKPGLNMDKLQNGFMGVIMYNGELCVSEDGVNPTMFPTRGGDATSTPICDLGQYIRAEQVSVMLSEDPRVSGLLSQRWVLKSEFDTLNDNFESFVNQTYNPNIEAQKKIDERQNNSITNLETLIGKTPAAPSAPGSAPVSAPAQSAGVPEVLVYALNGDEVRKAAFEADVKSKCDAWDAATKDKTLDEQFKIDVANTLDATKVPDVVAQYNAAKAAKALSESDLRKACLDARAVRNAQKEEYTGRVESNLVAQQSMAIGLLGGYKQGFVGGAELQWNPLANSMPLGGNGSFFVRHVGIDLSLYGVTGADTKAEKRTHDSGDGWSSTTTRTTVTHPFVGASAALRAPLYGSQSEWAVLSLEGGVNALMGTVDTTPSTVTRVEGGAPRRVDGDKRSETVFHGYGFGGLQLDLGRVFIEGGINSAGPTEKGNVTPYGTVGAVYRF